MELQALKFHKNMRSHKYVAYYGWHLHKISYKYHRIMPENKVILCTYTDNIQEDGDDDHQHNSAVHSIRKRPLPHMKPNTIPYCPTSACWPGFKRFPHSSHLRHSGCQS